MVKKAIYRELSLFSLFNGASKFMGYLMPKPSLKEKSSGDI